MATIPSWLRLSPKRPTLRPSRLVLSPPGSHLFSTSRQSYQQNPVPSPLPTQPSRLEAAYLSSLLREAAKEGGRGSSGSSGPGGANPNEGFIRRWRWYVICFLFGTLATPSAAIVYMYAYSHHWIPGTEAKDIEAFKEQQAHMGASKHGYNNQETEAKIPKWMQPGRPVEDPAASSQGTPTAAPGVTADQATALAQQLEQYQASLQAIERISMYEKELHKWRTHAKRYQEIAIAQHKFLLELICNSSSNSGEKSNPAVVLDDALLASRPIRLAPSGKRLKAPNAALVRVLDSAGKNRVIILAVDVDGSKAGAGGTKVTRNRMGDVNPWPSHCFGLHTWLLDLAEHLQALDANSERGVALYCLSNGVIVDVGKRFGSRVTLHYDKLDDVPAGFPLRQLRGIRNVQKAADDEDDDDDHEVDVQPPRLFEEDEEDEIDD